MAPLRPATTALFLIVAAILLPSPPSSAQSPVPAPSPGTASLDCTSYLLNMSDCLSYVEAGSNRTAPEAACCPELAGMVSGKPVCLCQLLNSADSFGIEISLNKALDLPSACRVSTPPVYKFCSAAGYPIGASSPSEAPTSPSGGPAAKGNDNGSGGLAISQLLCSAGLAIVTLSTFFWF